MTNRQKQREGIDRQTESKLTDMLKDRGISIQTDKQTERYG